MKLKLLIPALAILLFAIACTKAVPGNLLPDIKNYSDKRTEEFKNIPQERKLILEEIAEYISQTIKSNEPVNMIFICTHNSRRSHLAQFWAAAAAEYYGIGEFNSFSGGTESTAFNHRTVAAMQRAGFDIKKSDESSNPKYSVRLSKTKEPLIGYSKIYSDTYNAQSDFAAVMVCSDADESCPYIPNADERFAITYDDPKAFDDTNQESAKYDERCKQIATEMLYIFSKVKK